MNNLISKMNRRMNRKGVSAVVRRIPEIFLGIVTIGLFSILMFNLSFLKIDNTSGFTVFNEEKLMFDSAGFAGANIDLLALDRLTQSTISNFNIDSRNQDLALRINISYQNKTSDLLYVNKDLYDRYQTRLNTAGPGSVEEIILERIMGIENTAQNAKIEFQFLIPNS